MKLIQTWCFEEDEEIVENLYMVIHNAEYEFDFVQSECSGWSDTWPNHLRDIANNTIVRTHREARQYIP